MGSKKHIAADSLFTVVTLIVSTMTGAQTTRLKQQEKLGCKPGENRYIVNELGVGYRMLDAQE